MTCLTGCCVAPGAVWGHLAPVIDEAAMANLEQVCQQTISTMFTDFQGGAWFLSTPKGTNYVKALFPPVSRKSLLPLQE